MAIWVQEKVNNLNERAEKSALFFLNGEQMTNQVLTTTEEKLRSLIADEAKLLPMLTNMESTIRQMKAKQAFRIALLNQLLEEHYDKYSGN
jgi:dihydropteroate synthase